MFKDVASPDELTNRTQILTDKINMFTDEKFDILQTTLDSL